MQALGGLERLALALGAEHHQTDERPNLP
jgi:hypothetical protein